MDGDFDRMFVDLWEALPAFEKSHSHMDSYNDPKAVSRWEQMTRDASYTLYDDCVSALEQLLAPATWAKIVGRRRIGALIDLGAGTGGKTCKILKRLCTSSQPLQLLLVDASKPMLRHAYEVIRAELAPTLRTVPPIPIRVDIVKALERLRQSEQVSRHLSKQEADVYVLLGCTFANNPERVFLGGLRSTLAPGDILVVGTECFRMKGLPDRSSGDLLAPYRSQSFQAYWQDYCSKRYGADLDYGMLITLTYQEADRDSRVPDTRSITASITVAGRMDILMVSRRYDHSSLISFFRQFCFRHILSVTSPRNPHYVQMVFEKE